VISSSSSIAFLARQTEDDDDHKHDQEKFAASLSCSSSLSSSIAFTAGQTEDDDDHEHDQEKSRRFFTVLVLVVVFFSQQTEDDERARVHEHDQEIPRLNRTRRRFLQPADRGRRTSTSTIRKFRVLIRLTEAPSCTRSTHPKRGQARHAQRTRSETLWWLSEHSQFAL